VSGSRLEPRTRFFFSDTSRFLDVGRPLWREDGSVIYSYSCSWALSEQSLSGPSPADLMTIFYYLIWDSPNLEGQVPVFIYPRNRVTQVYPRALGSAGLRWRYSNSPPHGKTCFKSGTMSLATWFYNVLYSNTVTHISLTVWLKCWYSCYIATEYSQPNSVIRWIYCIVGYIVYVTRTFM
jgi:hypothetical protein